MKFTDFSIITSSIEYKLLSDEARLAFASLSLESICPDDEMLADVFLLDKGFLTKKDFIERSLKKAGVKTNIINNLKNKYRGNTA